MIKQYLNKELGVELLITKNQNESYSVIKKFDKHESEFHTMDDLESAIDLFDIWLENLGDGR